jgi:hypothetical protein
VNFVLYLSFRLPSVGANAEKEIAVWGADALGVMAIEMVVGLAALAAGFAAQARKTEFP